MRYLKQVLAIGCWIAMALPALAALAAAPADVPAEKSEVLAPAEPGRGNWELLAPLQVVRLDNGMVFLIYPNHRAPIFTGLIRFDIGGKDEKPGATGIAHMFEHMAFKGTPRIGTTDWSAERPTLERLLKAAKRLDALRVAMAQPWTDRDKLKPELEKAQREFLEAQQAAGQFVIPNEFDEIYSRAGGTGMNATTSSDATTYFISLPANRLELWMEMESRRIAEPVMREFYKERSVILEERRMRSDNNPTARLWDLLMATAFVASPYGYPVIGWADDIQGLQADQALRFHKTHYTPERAIGVLVGDLDVERTRALLEKYFGSIPPRPEDAEQLRITGEPDQEGLRRVRLRVAAQPTLMMGFHKPSAPDPADVHAQVLMQVLTGGRSSIWFERLVKQRSLAADIAAFSGPGDVLPNLFIIFATPQGETKLATLEEAVRAEIRRLHEEPVDAEALAGAKKMLRADTMRSIESNLGLARELASSAQVGHDPYYLEERLRLIERVTPEDLMQFAKKYLVEENMTIAETMQPDEGAKE